LSVLDAIVARTAREVVRRKRRATPEVEDVARADDAVAALRRDDAVRVIAEVKFRSPSAGTIRERTPGEAVRVARGYEEGGAAAISVLADRASFGGGALDVRRVAAAVSRPVLFKGFVLDEVQLDLAARVGASMALLLVRALDGQVLERLVRAAQARGIAPVVEAADEAELDVAVATGARIVGVNARDLHTFVVDPARARELVARIPDDRVAVYMSGVRSAEDLIRVAETRADAALVGEGLMRAEDPGRELGQWLRT